MVELVRKVVDFDRESLAWFTVRDTAAVLRRYERGKGQGSEAKPHLRWPTESRPDYRGCEFVEGAVFSGVPELLIVKCLLDATDGKVGSNTAVWEPNMGYSLVKN